MTIVHNIPGIGERCLYRSLVTMQNGETVLVSTISLHYFSMPANLHKFETMVFHFDVIQNKVVDWAELDGDRYDEASDAWKGHLEMCSRCADMMDPPTFTPEENNE